MTQARPAAVQAANLELKARDPYPGRTLAAAKRIGATDHGLIRQRDTFFAVPEGRLKLREQNGLAELIEYRRDDQPGPSPSYYQRLSVANPELVRRVLGDELGVTSAIEKERRLFVKDNIRIHLDRVRGLGTFIELETVAPPGHRSESQLGRLNALRRSLGIRDELLVAGAYVDQLASR